MNMMNDEKAYHSANGNMQHMPPMPMFMGGMPHGMPPSPQMQMPPSWAFNMGASSSAAAAVAAAAAAEEAAAEEARNVRGGYKCSKCGLPKKGHVCAYQPRLRRRDEDKPAEQRDMACQVEVDPQMTVRELNLSLQGTPESYPQLVAKRAFQVNSPSNAMNQSEQPNTPNNQSFNTSNRSANNSGAQVMAGGGAQPPSFNHSQSSGDQSPHSNSNSNSYPSGSSYFYGQDDMGAQSNSFNDQNQYFMQQQQPSVPAPPPPPYPPQQQYIQQAMPRN